MYRLLLALTLILALLASCDNPKDESTESFSHLSINERLERIFSENKEEKLVFDTKFPKEIKQLYTLNAFQPLWIHNDSLTAIADSLISFFDSIIIFGLPKHFYPINTIRISKLRNDPLQIELALSESLLRVIKHLHYGILDSASQTISWDLKHKGDYFTELIQSRHKDISIIQALKDLQPNHFQYTNLLRAWQNYLIHSDMDSTSFKVPKMKEDSLKAYETARKILVHKNYLDSSNASNDSLFLIALENYQTAHMLKADHVIGANTAVALEKSEWNKFQQVVLSLEKMKWSQHLSDKYFRINIGEQILRLIDSNRIVQEHRIIVGHLDTQTPELKSKLRRMVIYPYWNVPHSISSKELVYGARRDTGYWNKHNYKVFRGKTEIDPSTINWKKYNDKKFPFRIRQEPGPKNSLGLIKFLFPNQHSVYLHDTPTKWLFRTKTRYYSHGCMRLDKPQELAHYLIATDPKNKFIADSLETEFAKEERQTIHLREPIPIYIEYITVGSDSLGNIYFYNDHYRRDGKYINTLFSPMQMDSDF